MKKILVPTDFSDCAEAATETAIQIAKKAGAEIHFLHTLFTPVNWVNISLEREKLYPEIKIKIADAKNKLNKILAQARKQGVKASEFLVFDKGREEIEEYIKKSKYDLVVMGSHGTKGIKGVLGSNTQKVMRHSASPVLIIKRKSLNNGIKNIVFVSRFEADMSKGFKSVVAFANLFNATLHMVYINTPYDFKETEQVEKDMRNFIQKSGCKKYTFSIHNAFNEVVGIGKFEKSVHADIVSILSYGRSGLSRMMLQSLSENLANHSEIPVLSIHVAADKI